MTTKSTVCDRYNIGGQAKFLTQPSFVTLQYNNSKLERPKIGGQGQGPWQRPF